MTVQTRVQRAVMVFAVAAAVALGCLGGSFLADGSGVGSPIAGVTGAMAATTALAGSAPRQGPTPTLLDPLDPSTPDPDPSEGPTDTPTVVPTAAPTEGPAEPAAPVEAPTPEATTAPVASSEPKAPAVGTGSRPRPVSTPSAAPTALPTPTPTPTPTPAPTSSTTPNPRPMSSTTGGLHETGHVEAHSPGADTLAVSALVVASVLLLGLGGWLAYGRFFGQPVPTARER